MVISGSDITSYKFFDVSTLYVFDNTEDKVYFSRNLHKHGLSELLYLSPEVILYNHYGYFQQQRQ